MKLNNNNKMKLNNNNKFHTIFMTFICFTNFYLLDRGGETITAHKRPNDNCTRATRYLEPVLRRIIACFFPFFLRKKNSF
jgi:hypothetical protein